MANPSFETCPDFDGPAYANICDDIRRATGQTQEEVIVRLTQSWTDGHNERVDEWNQNREQEAAQQEAEAEKEKVEAEKKKPKMNGFDEASSVGDSIAPRPSQYAIQKLNNFDYVELGNDMGIPMGICGDTPTHTHQKPTPTCSTGDKYTASLTLLIGSHLREI
ncbi:uncharacterized protein HD556DRAFT_1314729 [Suillus plorans]|uniref:Uncharacterized protein n=1 Tax=Suillus plorans TaxID=116603 RepID=A0A9P7D981_9AGAM|nr:uncharacterized protein HD556DRAFT_1314729 [Suillus plorans]KAG1784875.1 hypothetical protein HD556DRAFT_1314729 [Suillus plorans]